MCHSTIRETKGNMTEWVQLLYKQKQSKNTATFCCFCPTWKHDPLKWRRPCIFLLFFVHSELHKNVLVPMPGTKCVAQCPSSCSNHFLVCASIFGLLIDQLIQFDLCLRYYGNFKCLSVKVINLKCHLLMKRTNQPWHQKWRSEGRTRVEQSSRQSRSLSLTFLASKCNW